jgi:alpha-glucosidase
MPANFHLLTTPWSAADVAALVETYEAALPEGAWPNWVLGNHDRPRLATRVGAAQAGVAAVLLLTLRGTPTLYYGDEIGMPDVPIPPDRVQDPWERRVPGLGRDPARTPMQWDARGGFSAAEPWLPYGDETISVADQEDDPASLLSLYRRLLRARREFADAPYETLAADGALAYRRGDFTVALNLGAQEEAVAVGGHVVVATDVAREGETIAEARLAPGEALVVHATAGGQRASSDSRRASASAIDATSPRSTDSLAAWIRARSESCAPQRTNAASGYAARSFATSGTEPPLPIRATGLP